MTLHAQRPLPISRDRIGKIGPEVAAHRLRGAAPPPRSFLFTFDDGFAECYDVMRPVVQRYGASGVFFVTTEFLDDRVLFFETRVSLCLAALERMEAGEARDRAAALDIQARLAASGRRALAQGRLSRARIAVPAETAHHAIALWLLGCEQEDEDEIAAACAALAVDPDAYSRRRLFLTADRVRELGAAGLTVGAHGLAHLPLQRMDSERIEREIVTSCQIVRDLTGQERVPFAFPYHGVGIDRRLLEEIRERHRFVELIFDSGDLRREAPFVVNRVWVDPPPAAGFRGTNLPASLRRAWSRRQAWSRSNPAGSAARSRLEPRPARISS
jgi:peptidoglycan/xylan/chitin deacetylase (PgdA/CDA1 family)